MNTETAIEQYLASLPDNKQADMRVLHELAWKLVGGKGLWFLDGKDESGKIVSNPNIGYGKQTMTYADGSSKEFYQVGISGNSTGISVYIMGLDDKSALARLFADSLGKAKVTGYCIKFKRLSDVSLDVLVAAMQYGVEHTK